MDQETVLPLTKFGKEYRYNYYRNNKEKWLGTTTCQLCNVTFKKNNKWSHNNTNRHKFKHALTILFENSIL